MKHVKTELAKHILTVRLNRPDMHNAFNPEMIAELTQVFRLIHDKNNEVVRAIVISAEGKSFCSGADLTYMKDMAELSIAENQADAERLFNMFVAIRSCPVPVVGRVFGNVMGGGLGLIAVCDIVAAQKDTNFAFSEARLGLVPSVISSFILEKIPLSHATEMMLTAETFDAAYARSIGLLNFVGEQDEVDDFVQSKVDFICNNGPQAMRETKALLRFVHESGSNDPHTATGRDVRSRTTRVIAERRSSAEGQEGLRSFFEKRKPSWRVSGKE